MERGDGVTVWYFFNKSLFGLFLAVLVGFIGSIVEILIAETGHFYYNVKHFHGIPYWLPFLYMTASVAVGNLGKKLYEPEQEQTGA